MHTQKLLKLYFPHLFTLFHEIYANNKTMNKFHIHGSKQLEGQKLILSFVVVVNNGFCIMMYLNIMLNYNNCFDIVIDNCNRICVTLIYTFL